MGTIIAGVAAFVILVIFVKIFGQKPDGDET